MEFFDINEGFLALLPTSAITDCMSYSCHSANSSGILADAEQQSVQEVEEQGRRSRGNQPGLQRRKRCRSYASTEGLFLALTHPPGKSSRHEMEEAAREADSAELLGCSSIHNFFRILL